MQTQAHSDTQVQFQIESVPVWAVADQQTANGICGKQPPELS